LEECEKNCQGSVGLNEMQELSKQLFKITNLLGQEIQFKKGIPMYYIYDDGSVEKKIIIE
jgi:predicted  nucleic acid-binding Zn ribbon protein